MTKRRTHARQPATTPMAAHAPTSSTATQEPGGRKLLPLSPQHPDAHYQNSISTRQQYLNCEREAAYVDGLWPILASAPSGACARCGSPIDVLRGTTSFWQGSTAPRWGTYYTCTRGTIASGHSGGFVPDSTPILQQLALF